MAEILGLGCTHYPGLLGPDEKLIVRESGLRSGRSQRLVTTGRQGRPSIRTIPSAALQASASIVSVGLFLGGQAGA